MKLKKKLVHALPLTAIVGFSGLAIAGTAIIKNNLSASADSESLAMNIAGNLNFEITPEVGGTYAEKTIAVTVNTGNSAGYTLYMASKNATANAMAEGKQDGITTVSTPVSKSNMPINSWGYNVGGDMINPIPGKDNAEAIATTDAPSNDNNKTTNVTVGVKVAPTLKSGNYSNILTFTATANTACEGFYCIDKMQDMTPAVCAATTTPLASAREVTFTSTSDNTKIPRTILTDTRDNKKYLVSKFADGKCWMSQSLELELSSTKALTSADTDLNTKTTWTPDKNTSNNLEDFVGPQYYSYPEDEEVYTAVSVRPTTKYLTNGVTPASAPSTNDGKSEWEKIGYYYSHTAATAGSNKDVIDVYDDYDQDAKDSICPKGWRLPYTSYYYGTDDAYNFIAAYDYNNDLDTINESFGYNLGGTVYSSDGTLSGLSSAGAYWLGGASDTYYKYASSISAKKTAQWGYLFSTDSYGYIMDGAQIRCIAR